MTKYIARVSHDVYGTHFRQHDEFYGPWWTEDIDKAKRYDTREAALAATTNVADDYTKEAIVAPRTGSTPPLGVGATAPSATGPTSPTPGSGTCPRIRSWLTSSALDSGHPSPSTA